MTETKAHDCAQAVTWLECLKCDGGVLEYGTRQETCQDCEGTGLRFPGLSEECYRRHSWDYGPDIKHPKECRCQGRGRMPIDSLKAWLDAAFDEGWTETGFIKRREGQHSASLQGYRRDIVVGYGSTRLEAITEALCRAIPLHLEEKAS